MLTVDDRIAPAVRTLLLLATLALAAAALGCGAQAIEEPNHGNQEPPQAQQQPRERQFSFYDRVELIEETFPYDEEHPAVGHWHGNVHTAFGYPAASIIITRNEHDEYSVDSSVTPGAPPHMRGEIISVDGRDVRFRSPLDPPAAGSLIFVGAISEDGQRMSGHVEMSPQMLQKNLEYLQDTREQQGLPALSDEEIDKLLVEWETASFELARTPLAVNLESMVAYGGPMEMGPDITFEIILAFAETEGGNWVGHIDIPQQQVGGWVLDKVKRQGDTFEAHMGGGSPAIITATVSEDGETLSGAWRYPNLDQEVAFTFERLEDYTEPTVPQREVITPSTRAQYPVEPYPYETRQVQIDHPDNHVLAGTLTVPPGRGPFPAVVLLPMAGPLDRDSNMFGHRWFLVLADRLTRDGIAVLRYDKRGVAQSTGSFQSATIHDLATDAQAAYGYLKALDIVQPESIGFIGHAEGALVGAIAAGRLDDPAFLAMLAPQGVPGWRYELDHFTQTFAERPQLDQELANSFLIAQEAFFHGIIDGVSAEELQQLGETLAEREAAITQALGSTPSVEPPMRARLIISRWKRPAENASLAFDPAPVLAELDCPVWAAWGSLDRHSTEALNRPAIEAAFQENAAVTPEIRSYEGLNHLFQPAQTGAASEFGAIRTTFEEQVMDDLAAWIMEAVMRE